MTTMKADEAAELNELDSRIRAIELANRKQDQINQRIERPWHRDAPSIIAILALIFSFGTTVISYYKSSVQEVVSYRTELSAVIKELTNIAYEHTEMYSKYQNQPDVVALLSSEINNKNLSLGNRGEALINRIESTAYGRGTVVDVEYLSVATSLLSSFQFHRASVLFSEANRRARDATTEATALRNLANIAFNENDFVQMRALLGKAIKVFDNVKYQETPPAVMHVTHATTEMNWALSEAHSKNCDGAGEHMQRGLSYIAMLPEGNLKERLVAQSDQGMQSIKSVC